MMRLPTISWFSPYSREIMRIEEVPERPVAHVVQQGRHPHERLDVAAAGHVGADLAEALVGRLDHAAGQVHRPQHVLETGVLGRRVDQPGGLQLVDLAEPLDPGIIDDRLFGNLAVGQPLRRNKRDVAVDDVVAQAGVEERIHARIIRQSGRGVKASCRTEKAPAAVRSIEIDRGRRSLSGYAPLRLRPDVHHPHHAEAVDEHAELCGKEGLGQRHLHLAAFAQAVEEPLGLGLGRDGQRKRKTLEIRRPGAVAVGHQHRRVADAEAGVHHLLGDRRAPRAPGCPCSA